MRDLDLMLRMTFHLDDDHLVEEAMLRLSVVELALERFLSPSETVLYRRSSKVNTKHRYFRDARGQICGTRDTTNKLGLTKT